MLSDITVLEEELITTYISLSADVLFLFDCLLTLSQEVDVIWRRKWNTTTWLYVFMRYSLAIDVSMRFLPVWNFARCKFIVHVDEVLSLMQFLCLAWFSALRVYALLDGKYLVTALVLLLNAVPFATNTFNYATSIVVINTEECTFLPRGSNALILSLSLATRISVIIGDVLVLAVTWRKTAHAYQESRRLNIRAPLATMLFRDGTIYFLILLVLNILQMLEDHVVSSLYTVNAILEIIILPSWVQPIFLSIHVIDTFSDIVSPMIICHFILNLRQFEPAGSSWASADQSRSLRFVGNMGQSLQFGIEDANGEDEDVPGVKGASAEAVEVDEEYVRRNYDTEQETTYTDV